jgi:hypothetical protein
LDLLASPAVEIREAALRLLAFHFTGIDGKVSCFVEKLWFWSNTYSVVVGYKNHHFVRQAAWISVHDASIMFASA